MLDVGAGVKTSRVHDIEAYWTSPPPERSARCVEWLDRIAAGWRPNRRVRSMGYYYAADFFGVYIWEYMHVLSPVVHDASAGVRASWHGVIDHA